MEIISLSIDEETRRKIEEIEDKTGFNGRSELLRKAVNELHQSVVERSGLNGELNALIVARHPHQEEHSVSEIAHRNDDVITTQLHSKLDGEKCLEIFHVEGDADRVISLYNDLQGSKNTESVTLLPQNH